MSDKYETHDDDEATFPTDAENRETERDAAPYRELLKAINAARKLAQAIGTSETKYLDGQLADAIGDCAPLNALIDFDKYDDAFSVRQAMDAISTDAAEARKARPILLASPTMQGRA